ncbi:MAG TPA: imidazole glycerol phosphate synthase subunit HisH [Nitrososphaerales archaeon]|nr:imidazole glycerol phosphate synthase subunit HisH [Nitrososphaerales archaeon]
MVRVAIFDYGSGNLFSLKAALERLGASVEIITKLENLDRFDGLILPGVGNFDPAIKSIKDYRKQLDKAIESGMPMLGICLGMEMLFNRSEEGKLKGLSILDGDVVMLPKKVKIPHMGWNNLNIVGKSKLLQGMKDNAWVYFVHSYHAKPKDRNIVVANSEYGTEFPAVIEHENLFGTQFHPEKSSDVGAVMLKNFLRECER